MELQIDFSQHLPKHLTPGYDKVVSLLTQTVSEWPRGSAMLTRENKGIFSIKLWDKTKAEKLVGKKIEFYYEGDKSAKKVTVTIEDKPKFLKYQNPKYITMTGFNRFPAEKVSNEQLDQILKNYGDIIVPTQDVFADLFLTGKKKVRIDLNKGMDLPRNLFIEFSDSGRKFSTSIRCFYKDQPYLCKRCSEQHVGDCPEWLKEKFENEKVKKMKFEQSKTAMIGDSNLRCINERGVMASVTSITGGKIGHISNQVRFENLSKIQNVVLSAGQNCLNDIDEVRKDVWESRTKKEIASLENVVDGLMKEGKKVFILDVPPTPIATATKGKKEGRRFINNKLSELAQRAMAKKSKGVAAFIEENEGNFNSSTDFTEASSTNSYRKTDQQTGPDPPRGPEIEKSHPE